MDTQITKRPSSLTDTPFTYCPGCGHGIANRLIAETIDELDIKDRTIAVWPIGCSVFGPDFFKLDSILASHGKAPAVATGVARALRLSKPDSIVFTYQGDGDLASIGFNEILHAANRGWGITVFFVNNGVYGMTSGQLAPTSLLGQRTTTSLCGREIQKHGHPIPVCEVLASLHSSAYITRVALFDAKHIIQAKKAIRKAFEVQIEHKGFSFVEILSPCPINWGLTPNAAMERIEKEVVAYYPLGVFKDASKETLQQNPTELITEPQEKYLAIHSTEAKQSWQGSEELIIAGFGGQGILTAGEFISLAALNADKHVVWMPSYGPEMRGGTAKCSVIYSDQEIASPMIESPSALLVMNKPSFDTYVPIVKSGGIVIINSSIIDSKVERIDIRTVYIPANDIANNLGNIKIANVVMLGAYAALRGLSPELLMPGIERALYGKEDIVRLNKEALRQGYDFISDTQKENKKPV